MIDCIQTFDNKIRLVTSTFNEVKSIFTWRDINTNEVFYENEFDYFDLEFYIEDTFNVENVDVDSLSFSKFGVNVFFEIQEKITTFRYHQKTVMIQTSFENIVKEIGHIIREIKDFYVCKELIVF